MEPPKLCAAQLERLMLRTGEPGPPSPPRAPSSFRPPPCDFAPMPAGMPKLGITHRLVEHRRPSLELVFRRCVDKPSAVPSPYARIVAVGAHVGGGGSRADGGGGGGEGGVRRCVDVE
eukprot:481080-Pleurochrysis_carterae.AAC.1